MTAGERGLSALEHATAAARKIRGYWVLITFFIGLGVWATDTWQAHAPLPDLVAAQAERLKAIEKQVARHCKPRGLQALTTTASAQGLSRP
ncbi:MAG: hypothetical protein AAFR52_04885 [Pseudomonadota bacterium]